MSYSPFGQTLPPIPVGGDSNVAINKGAGILSAPTVGVNDYNPVAGTGGSGFMADWATWYDSASANFTKGAAKFAGNAALFLVLIVLLFVMLNASPADLVGGLPGGGA